MNSITEVTAGIIINKKRVLVAQRLPGSHMELKWEFPGGKIKKGESRENCLIRELKEELGVDIQILKFFETVEFSYPEKDIRLHFFICTIKKGIPVGHHCRSFIWANKENLKNIDFLPADRVIINKVARLISKSVSKISRANKEELRT